MRPNHALANAIRKALLVPIVINSYREHFSGTSYGGKQAFDHITPELIEAMQVSDGSIHANEIQIRVCLLADKTARASFAFRWRCCSRSAAVSPT